MISAIIPLLAAWFNPLTQKIKAPQHLSQLHSGEKYSHSSSRIQLPSLQRRKSWKDEDDNACGSTLDRRSTPTSTSWSPDAEEIGTYKVWEQWEAVERTLFNEDNQVEQAPLLEECIQWRTQIPHLRVVGKNPLYSTKKTVPNSKSGSGKSRSEDVLSRENSQISSEQSIAVAAANRAEQSDKTIEEEILDVVLEYVISELFQDKENEIDSSDNLSDVLKISQVPLYSDKSSGKSGKNNWSGIASNLSRRFSIESTNSKRNSLASGNHKDSYRKSNTAQSNLEARGLKPKIDEGKVSTADMYNRLQSSRNKLGKVFNEKIVVSPVPHVLLTRESFSTVKTTPIKFMPQTLSVSASQESGRNHSVFKYSARASVTSTISNGHSAWHAPVHPTVWPKNIKLAPLDTSRLPSSKNRSVAKSPVLRRNRKSLSPIPRGLLPVSAHAVFNSSNDDLEIRGKHVGAERSMRSQPPTSKGRKTKNYIRSEK